MAHTPALAFALILLNNACTAASHGREQRLERPEPEPGSVTAAEPGPASGPTTGPTGPATDPGSADSADSGSAELDLAVPGFEPAIVVLPPGNDRVPVVVAAHGAGGDATWQCAHWRRIVRNRAVVLCPRGKRISRAEDYGFYYPNHIELEREFRAMLAETNRKFGNRILRGSGIYTGFSQGATMGALMIIDHGSDFPYLLLIEGATGEFSTARARRYRATGGREVAFVCGGTGCAERARKMAQILRTVGLKARVEHVVHGGHTDDGRVGERAAQVFEAMLSSPLTATKR
jgi:predicted esterase